MTTTIYHPLSDMNQIKGRLIAMFGLDANITRLIKFTAKQWHTPITPPARPGMPGRDRHER